MMHIHGRTAVLTVALAALLIGPASAFAPTTVREIDAAAEGYLHYSLGRLMELEGLYAEALVQYRRAHSLNPGDCELPTATARVLFEMGRLDEALEGTRLAREGCPDAVEPLALEADALLLLERPEEAEEILKRAFEDAGVELDRAVGLPSRLVVLLGQSLEAQSRMAEARTLYAGAAAADTLDPEMAFLHARANLVLGDTDAALRELWRSHTLQPENRTAAATLVRLLDSLDRHEEALPVLERLVRRGDATTAEYLALARSHALTGNLDLSHAALDDASRIWGETPPLLRARASIYFAAGRTDSAAAVHRRLIEHDPEAVTSLNFLAYELADKGENLEEALDLATRARELAPESPLVRDTLGWTYYRLGRYEEAILELELAVSLGAQSPVVLEHLGDAYDALGRVDDARDAWRRALELDPERNTTLQRLSGGMSNDGH